MVPGGKSNTRASLGKFMNFYLFKSPWHTLYLHTRCMLQLTARHQQTCKSYRCLATGEPNRTELHLLRKFINYINICNILMFLATFLWELWPSLELWTRAGGPLHCSSVFGGMRGTPLADECALACLQLEH